MLEARRRSLVLALATALAAAGCASDPDPEPELDLEMPGAFVAVDEGGPALTLHRTLDVFTMETGRIIFLSVYDVAPTSWDEARELSKRHDLPLRSAVTPASLGAFPAGPYRVVWFRTLEDDEKARLR